MSPQDLYSSRDLQGLTVEHDLGAFREGETLVLTLKDKGEWGGGLILGGQGGDTGPVMPPGDMKKGTSRPPRPGECREVTWGS